jgi:hypothetical protein
MPFFPPINPSLQILELVPDEHQRSRRVLVRLERKEGDCPSISLKVYALQQNRHDAWWYIGSFGGRLDYIDETGPLYHITDGDMHLRDLRGLRIGTWCQNQVMHWLLEQPPGRTRRFSLSEIDAGGPNRERRNRFYEQFGSRFEWDIPGVAGRSFEQPTSDFRTLDSIPGVRILTFDVALAKAYSHIEFLEQDLKGKRMQFANVNKQMDSEAARNRMYCRVCTIVVAVTVVTELFLRLK